MRIKPEQLEQSLEKSNPGILIISGNEPLLVQEASDQIRSYCRRQGFSERLSYQAGKGFDWSVLDEHCQSFSLFGDKQLLEIQLATLPSEQGKERLKRWVEKPPEDCCLLLTSDKLESKTLNTKWFKALESASLHIQIWPVTLQQLPQWISHRLQQAGFRPTASAITALCDHVEGNLLAAKQEIDKLQLLNSDSQIDERDILASVSDSNKYSVFNLVDACLDNDHKQVVKILRSLEAEAFEPAIVLWSLSREIRVLAKLYSAVKKGQSLDTSLQKERIFKNKWSRYQRYLQQTHPSVLPKAHHYCHLSEKAIKGIEPQPCWRLLTQASLLLAGLNIRGDSNN